MAERTYTINYVDGQWHLIITEDGKVEIAGRYATKAKAEWAEKQKKIANHDIEPDKVVVRNRNGNFASLVSKEDVDTAIDQMKTPKDLQKIMKKILKSELSVKAIATVLFNPLHPKYDRVLDIATRIATEVPKVDKDGNSSVAHQSLVLNIVKPEETRQQAIDDMEEIQFVEMPVSGSNQ